MEGSSSKRPLENPEENSNPSKKVRKAYTLEFKRNVIDEVKSSNNLRATASRYGLDHTVVLRWRKAFEKQSSNSNQNQNTKFRMSGAGRPVLDTEMEDNLFSWICYRRENQWRVTRSMIQTKAKELSNSYPVMVL